MQQSAAHAGVLAADEAVATSVAYDLKSGRWFLYLVLGIVGSIVGAVIISTIWMIGATVALGPFAMVAMFGPAMFVSFIWIPIYTLLGVFLGLLLAKGHAMSVHNALIETDSDLTRRVAEMARAAGLRKPPEVAIYASPDMNALATGSGRNNSLVLFSTALLEQCTKEEVDAVAAHEIGHIASNDMLAMSLVNSIQNSMSWIMGFYQLRMLVRHIVFFITELGALHLSRKREFRADAVSAALLGKANMISALERLREDASRTPKGQRGYAMMKITHPAFATHPPIGDRIDALKTDRYLKMLPFEARHNPTA